MRETQQNIRNYRKKLVGVKSKLATAGLLFLVSAVMLTTASFAWITLSLNPEVKGIATTVVGNGNLEIALVTSDENHLAKVPAPSEAGDSNKNLVEKNTTWGNLINLNDNSYGLSSIVLRPAALTTSAVIDSPLVAIIYGSDGRTVKLDSDFKYSNYNLSEQAFVIPDGGSPAYYGVRAISSVIETASGEDAQNNLKLLNTVKDALDESTNTYLSLVNNQGYLKSIADLMGVFLTDKLNDSDSNVVSYMPTFYSMMEDFHTAMVQLGNVYVQAANVQITKKNLSEDLYTFEKLMNDKVNEKSLQEQKITLMTGLDDFKKDYKNLLTHMENIEATLDESTVKMADILPDINYMVEINTCLIDGKYSINDMGSMGYGELFGMLSGTHEGTIQGGALQRFEKRTGAKMDAKNMSISAKYIISVSVKANISTNASSPFTLPVLIDGSTALSEPENTLEKIVMGETKTIRTAGDVYGMSIDLWLRTNVDESYLVLEGEAKLLYEVDKTASGYLCYVGEDDRVYYHIPDKNHPAPVITTNENIDELINIDSTTYLLYGDFYDYSTNQKIVFLGSTEEEIVAAKEPFVSTLKYKPKTVVTGYDGVNRVWEESENLIDSTLGTSTTSGGGSCYIFYPDDPIEQERMLQLLAGLSVAFLNDSGDEIARAVLNTEHAYEEVGKVTVPLEFDTEKTSFFVDDNGNDVYYITELIQNEPKMISAVVYLDGEKVQNNHVSSSGNIKGYLNLQFGSSGDLESLKDDELKSEYVQATATIDRDKFEVTDLPAETNLSVSLSGLNATGKDVKVNFVRQVNDHQGVMLDDLPLVMTASGEKASTWEATQIFTVPGTYVLNSVWVDSVEYELTSPVSVEVEGFEIISLSWNQGADDVYKMTSNNVYPVSLTVDVSASDQFRPTEMTALFRNEFNEYMTVYLSPMGTAWSGTGTFATSGKYVLEYLTINKEIYPVVTNEFDFEKTINLVLGINAIVELDHNSKLSSSSESNLEFTWDARNLEGNVVEITSVKILDNKGNPVEQLEGVKLFYNLSGSMTKNLHSNLVWDKESKSYIGENASAEFLVNTPGIYIFDRIFIADTATEDENDGSTLKTAVAPKITAISPYPVEFLSETLTVDDYQFVPEHDASFVVQMKHSSTATPVAKMLYQDNDPNTPDKIVYVPGLIDSDNAETSITTWKFMPFVNSNSPTNYPYNYPSINVKEDYVNFNFSQDGIWTIQEILLNNVYSGDDSIGYKWYSAEGEWWKNEDKSSFVSWNNEDLTTNVISQVTVTASASNRSQESFTGVFTDSLSDKYTVSGYSIQATDSLGRVLSSEMMESYGLSIKQAALAYLFSPDTTVYNATNGWVESINGKDPATDTYRSEMEAQTISFTSAEEKMIFRYAGQYTPILSVKMNYLKNGVATEVDEHLITVKNNVPTETVQWLRPDVHFVSLTPAAGVAHYVSEDARNVTGVKKANQIVDEHHIEVWFEADTTEGHAHTEQCVTTGHVLHFHGEDCCINELHTHSDLCCSKEVHAHVESCYSCGQEYHSHDESGCTKSCNKWSCGKTEHIHSSSCSTSCGKTVHSHTDGTCVTSCGKVAHTHGDGNCTCPTPAHHTHTDAEGCFQNCNNVVNTWVLNDMIPPQATAKLINAGTYTSATLKIDSSNETTGCNAYTTDVNYSFNSSTNMDTKNIGLWTTISGNDYAFAVEGVTTGGVYTGAKATNVTIVNDKGTFIITLPTPLTVNENEGSNGYY